MRKAPWFFCTLLLVVKFSLTSEGLTPNVEIWNPPFSAEAQKTVTDYQFLKNVSKRWKICVSIPHLKDAFWLAVNYGLIDQAKKMGVGVRIYSAGGYDQLAAQKRQLREALELDYDALILSGISSTELDEEIKLWTTKGKPVIDLINFLDSKDITARAAVSYTEMAQVTGQQLLKHHQDKTAKVAWFPGPEGAGWSQAGNQGFINALKGSKIDITSTIWGDTGKETQANLIRQVLNANQDIDYIVGTTVTAEAAVEILREKGLDKKIGIMAYYYGPGVDRGIKRGRILGAPTDQQAISARLAIDVSLLKLEQLPFSKHISPTIQWIDRTVMRKFDFSTTLAPRGFRAIFSIND